MSYPFIASIKGHQGPIKHAPRQMFYKWNALLSCLGVVGDRITDLY